MFEDVGGLEQDFKEAGPGDRPVANATPRSDTFRIRLEDVSVNACGDFDSNSERW